jgi:hypothetical protein
MSRLFYEVQNDPSEVNWRVEAEQRVSGRPVALPSDARYVEIRCCPHDFVRPLRLRPIAGARIVDAEAVGSELIGTRRELRREIAAFDPAPLDMREMVDDPDDRQQTAVRPPPRLLVRQSIGDGNKLLALVVEGAQQQLTLVGRRHDFARCGETHPHRLPWQRALSNTDRYVNALRTLARDADRQLCAQVRSRNYVESDDVSDEFETFDSMLRSRR